ncbi:ABC transporter permease [Azospirillum soli]|uniref:ABC transporter permease n=1 Tax=Azospirillum soli TaxID=1304799 RepID=UPI001AEAE685|nr:ABC transporter permease [Azospirillum soli]MBP2314548.1 putative hydroxymethylpyrimidine transport system permease protein [Azospirillum soli]
MRILRALITLAVLLGVWQAIVLLTGVPRYILPAPLAVADALQRQAPLLIQHGTTTLIEILLGLGLGVALGSVSALTLASFRTARRWLMPVLVVSQAIPVFALAPLLVLWLGYGMASKIAMATLIIYFPVTTALFDGLRRTEAGWLDLARTMGASRRSVLWHIRLPAALPAFGSGVRVAAAVAPIGAVIGEWVGSSSGLGYLMLHANARMQIDLLFAALAVLGVFAVTLYAAVDALIRWALPWQPDSHPAQEKD